MTRIAVRNLGSVPVTIDRTGHQLGAGEFGVVNDGDHVAAAAIAAGKLGAVDRPGDGVDVDPGAAAAFAQLDAGTDDEPSTTVAVGGGGSSSSSAGGSGSGPAAAKTTSAREKGR